MRIGTNHGSLSDRIMNRYGDTPLGMVESALEFARIARDLDYHAFIFSMKSSNPKVMIEAYRLLVARLREEGRGLELSDPSRRDRSRRRRRRADQERDRDRLALARRHRRHHPRFAHRGQRPRDSRSRTRWSRRRGRRRYPRHPALDNSGERPFLRSVFLSTPRDAPRSRSARCGWAARKPSASSFARRTSTRSRTRSIAWATTNRSSFTKARA